MTSVIIKSNVSHSQNIFLLQVNKKIFSVNEMKTAAEDIKKLRPIQEAIMVALKVDSWKEIPETIKSKVTASNLARFMVKYSTMY